MECRGLCVRLSVCQLVTNMIPAKTAEPIELSLRVWTRGLKEPSIRYGETRIPNEKEQF